MITHSCRWISAWVKPAGLVALLVGMLLVIAAADPVQAQSASGRVVAEAGHTSPFDAFMKMNRLQEKFAKGQNASEYWGVMESRLGNQAGRILIKRPAKGFSDDAFRGWVMFIRAYGGATGVGNCAACHTVPEFTDKQKHDIGTAKEPVETPSLRNLSGRKTFFRDQSAKTLEEAISRHVEQGRIAREKKQPGDRAAIGQISLTDDEVRKVATFLRSLDDVERGSFRDYLVNVVVQPVELEFSN